MEQSASCRHCRVSALYSQSIEADDPTSKPSASSSLLQNIKKHNKENTRDFMTFFAHGASLASAKTEPERELYRSRIEREQRLLADLTWGGFSDLAVDDGGARLDVPGVVRDLLEALGPVVSDLLVGQVDLNAVAVELDFVNPSLSGRHLFDRGCQDRFDEAGEGRLYADRRRFSTLKRHARIPRNNRFIGGYSNRSGTRESFPALQLHS